MKKIQHRLTELDIKHINSILSHTATDIELRFIELALYYELENRGYLQILNRLNEGFKRKVDNKIEVDQNLVLQIHNGLKIYNSGLQVQLDRDETTYTNSIDNLDCLLDNIVINNFNYTDAEQLIKKAVRHRNKNTKTGGRYLKSVGINSIFFTSMSVNTKIENSNILASDSKLYKISFGKRTIQKHINSLHTFIQYLKDKEISFIAKSINWNGLGSSLIELIQDCGFGINITKNTDTDSIDSYFIDDKSLSILCVIPQQFSSILTSICAKINIDKIEIGNMIEEPNLLVNTKAETIINLPITAFDIQLNTNTHHFKQPQIETEVHNKLPKGIKNTSYSNQMLKILSSIIETDKMWESNGNSRRILSNNLSYGIFSNIINDGKQLVLTQADNNNLIDIAPRLSGRIAVANVTRRLSCTGAKPIAVTIQNIFPKNNITANWKASEILQGQEEAIRELELKIGNRTITSYAEEWHQNITCMGIIDKSVDMDISLKNNGDFISLLGSHRGELSKSTYEQFISNDGEFVQPSVDLRMEKRLQDVVHQGINTDLIKSATNVGAGGIAIAVAKSLMVSDEPLGARIHLSRKLTEEELLFGETQGLVIVTLSEEDIMEFERICMTVGVPSTTIGRVTDNNLFTFNDLIKIKVDRLRKIF